MSTNTKDSQPGKIDTLGFLWKVHGYTNEYIRFADPKAGFAVVIFSGLIAAMFSAKCHHLCSPARLSWREATLTASLLGTLALAPFVLLLLAVMMMSWAIARRLWAMFYDSIKSMLVQTLMANPPKGFIFWDEILAHREPAEFAKAVRHLNADEQIAALAKQTFVLASIASTKFKWITLGFRVGFVGAALAAFVLFVS